MKAKWIWHNKEIRCDEYTEFIANFNSTTGIVNINISADTNYAIYINNRYVEASQYACFPYEPVMDSINLNVKKGINDLKIIVYYNGGESFSTYYKDLPGLFFEIYENNELILVSDENIKSALSKTYSNHLMLPISPQLGFTFSYNANFENLNLNYENSICIEKNSNFKMRENYQLRIKKPVKTNIILNEKNHYIIDLLKEQTGFIKLQFNSPIKQKITVAFGEHINDGCVRRIIGNRTFSFDYIAKPGFNNFTSVLRRFGCRYLEVFCESTINIKYIGLVPTVYPFVVKPFKISNPLRNKIYKTSVYTLKCCYHEHYEDCPWREQAFYALDSRNQILSGYYAFENHEQVRSALRLIALDNRKDGLLSICYPSCFNLTIPSFSLHYFTAIYEYYKHTKDKTLLQEKYPKLKSLMEAFINRIDDGLFIKFNEDCHWNFYEWSENLDYPDNKDKTDLIINCLLIIALKNMHKISRILNVEDNYQDIAKALKKQTNRAFYSKKRQLYFMSNTNESYSTLGNSLAILSGVASVQKRKHIANELVKNRLTPITLSMKCFLYDALLMVDKNYQKFILNDIDIVYKKMLDADATTFWETELGEKDFDNAGSLCHGWCALPIYYYHLFKIVK